MSVTGKFVLVLIAVAVGHYGTNADSTSFGKCPHVEPQPDFKMDEFLGTWYVIQKTATNVPCLSYNVTEKPGHPGYYLLKETYSTSKLAKFVGLGHEQHIVGDLCVADPHVPAVMNLDVPLDIGHYQFTVFLTDYVNFAAVFSCKTYPLTFSSLHKWSAIIMSRTPKLDIKFVEIVRTRLSAFNIDPFSMTIINQKHCKPGEKGVILQAASNAVHKVSETVGNVNEHVIKPAVDKAVHTVKAAIDEATDSAKAILDTATGGLNTIFENPGLNEDLNSVANTADKVIPITGDSPKPSYYSAQN
ncbi:hypothetical protein FQA39_LY16977 [Lamprigera yunnana]|nr:hypothetical protein FQA39_LY16977 [Lamprigera yunnana]